MHWLATIAGVILIFVILLDAFETVVLPRRIQRTFQSPLSFTEPHGRDGCGLRGASSGHRDEGFLAYFGPLSLILLLGFWALGLIFGFTYLQYGLSRHLQFASSDTITFEKMLYHCGETLFTLGYGDMVSRNPLAHFWP